MSILNDFFGRKSIKNNTKEEQKSTIEWYPLTSLEQLRVIEEESKDMIIGIFKHSTRCAISRTVLNRFSETSIESLPIKMYYLDLLNFREISNEIEYRFQIIHQSPQLLLIGNKKIVAHASHYDIISNIDLQQFAK